MGWLPSLAIFGAAALLLFVGTRILIPWLARATGMEPVVAWFVVGGLFVFTPLVIGAYVLLRREPGTGIVDSWAERLRFRRMNRADWLWTLGALVAIGVATTGIQALIQLLHGSLDLSPSFMAFEPLTPGRLWILAAWLPFWILNIMGEEVLWRGVVLPRQEAALGRLAWMANGAGWLLFHLAFGWQLVLVLVPIIFVLPYVVQRRRNTWIGVVVHAGLNGPAFVAIALGLV